MPLPEHLRTTKVKGPSTVSSAFETMEQDLKAREIPSPDGPQRAPRKDPAK